jgi:hypothetical protein
MTSFNSVDKNEYINKLLNLCINLSATHKDFCDLLLFSDQNECATIFENTFGITPFNYSFSRRRTHPREHAAKIFEHITKPETQLEIAIYWIAMTIYIIRVNVSGCNPVNLNIDEMFFTDIYQPLIVNLNRFDFSNHENIKAILNEHIADIKFQIEYISSRCSFSDCFLRTVSYTGYESPYAFN